MLNGPPANQSNSKAGLTADYVRGWPDVLAGRGVSAGFGPLTITHTGISNGQDILIVVLLMLIV
jgi:hypothetical protein